MTWVKARNEKLWHAIYSSTPVRVAAYSAVADYSRAVASTGCHAACNSMTCSKQSYDIPDIMQTLKVKSRAGQGRV